MSSTSSDAFSFAGSSILRQSPPFHPSSHTGPGGADLSLSELYISDREEDATVSKPFSLLPQRPQREVHDGELERDENEPVLNRDDNGNEVDDDDEIVADQGKKSLSEARTREERLQHDLFVLKKLNASFSLYNDALNDTRSSTENVALQLDRMDRLLDQYVYLLRHSENNSRLIFDKTWEGGAADQETLDGLRVEAAQKAQHEREQREDAARRERERLEREEQEQMAREVRDAKEKEKRTSSGLVRGVRGVRGIRSRGTERGASAAARGRIPSAGGGAVASSRGGRRS